MKMKALRYPDFICIGAQKAGTSWFHRMLRLHPAIWLPPTKEIHYFDVIHVDGAPKYDPERDPMRTASTTKSLAAITWVSQSKMSEIDKLERLYTASLIGLREMTDEWYGRIFERVPADMLCGDITPGYAVLPDEGIKHILRLRPSTKIIFIIRDPIDRGWSELRMVQGLKKMPTISAIPQHIASARFYARCDYMATIDRFQAHIPKNNFLLLYFDDIVRQPRQLLADVYAFLGIENAGPKVNSLFERVHQGMPATISAAHYDLLKRRLAPAYERLRELNNSIADAWYRKHYI